VGGVVELSVVVPVYNEAGSIEALVADLAREVVPLAATVEVIVVDDASNDSTPQILETLAAVHPWLVVVRSPRNRGHGPSVLHGLARAHGRWIFQIDSDGQFVVAEFDCLWQRRADCDLALGVRVDRHDPAHRLVLSFLVRLAVSLLARRRLRDPNTPFRLMRRELWDDLAPLIGDSAAAPSIFTLVGAAVRSRRIVEIPVTHLPREGGRSSLRNLRLVGFSLRGLAELVAFRIALARAGRNDSPAARDALPFAIVAAVALCLRLALLGRMPLHHDESEHAWFAWLLRSGHGYRYNPVFHGPVQFYLMSLADVLFGTSDLVARVAPALAGATITALPFFLRRELGRIAALTASVALCLAPSYLYFSRFAREDIYAACVTLALFVVVLRLVTEPRRWHPSALLGLLAVSFAVKETTFITIFLLGLFAVGAAALQGIRARRAGASARDGALVRSIAAVGADAWAWGVATFLVVYTLLFTTFLTNPGGLREGLVGSIRYWLSQQPVGRGGQPWFYYLVLLPAYEWPIVILGLVGAACVLVRPTVGGVFLVWMFCGSLVIYSWASERMPWLVLHPLLPLILLAGVGTQSLIQARRRRGRRFVLVIAALGGATAVYSAVALAYVRPADPRELLVQVQTSVDVPPIRNEILRVDALMRRTTGHPLTLEVDSWGGTGWPWAWYLRDLPAAYFDMSAGQPRPAAQAVLVAEPNRTVVQPLLRGYVVRRFRLRVWWVPNWGAAGVRQWFWWLVERKAWSPTASLDELLYLRADVARAAVAEETRARREALRGP
jgi:uncharacterized protein (TIGR03663 family)